MLWCDVLPTLVCITASGNMYSYGVFQNDLSLPPIDDYSHGPITIPVDCFPFGVLQQFSVYVSEREKLVALSFSSMFSVDFNKRSDLI